MNKIILVIGGILILVVGFVLGVIGGRQATMLGGVVYEASRLVGDVYQGMSGQLMMSNGEFVGPINTANSVIVSGATVLKGTVNVSQSTSSTLIIGNTDNGIGTGCLVLGNSNGVTSSPVYITAAGATISATTTKPAICR